MIKKIILITLTLFAIPTIADAYYVESFEIADGFSTGTWNGVNNWKTDAAANIIITDYEYAGQSYDGHQAGFIYVQQASWLEEDLGGLPEGIFSFWIWDYGGAGDARVILGNSINPASSTCLIDTFIGSLTSRTWTKIDIKWNLFQQYVLCKNNVCGNWDNWTDNSCETKTINAINKIKGTSNSAIDIDYLRFYQDELGFYATIDPTWPLPNTTSTINFNNSAGCFTSEGYLDYEITTTTDDVAEPVNLFIKFTGTNYTENYNFSLDGLSKNFVNNATYTIRTCLTDGTFDITYYLRLCETIEEGRENWWEFWKNSTISVQCRNELIDEEDSRIIISSSSLNFDEYGVITASETEQIELSQSENWMVNKLKDFFILRNRVPLSYIAEYQDWIEDLTLTATTATQDLTIPIGESTSTLSATTKTGSTLVLILGFVRFIIKFAQWVI